MGNLEDFIDRNRELFDDQEPGFGHEKRFMKKLNSKKSQIGLRIWYSVAAGFIMLAMFSFFAKDFIFDKNMIKNNSKIMSLSDISFKYQEVEEFYQAGIDEKIIEFKQLECKVDQEQMVQIDKELKQFDDNYLSLQIELQRNKNDERIINAMITNYQTKIRFLELVIDQIRQNC